MSGFFITDKHKQRLMLGALWLLASVSVLWLCWTLAGLFWLATGHTSDDLPKPTAQKVESAPRVDVNRLASLDLFGRSNPAASSSAGEQRAPDTTLQLRLAGVFVNRDPAASSAIVAERNNPQAPARSYRVQDSLPGGAVIKSVHDDHIVLQRNDGSSEILRFEKTDLLGGKPTPATPSASPPTLSGSPQDMMKQAMQSFSASPDGFLQQMGLRASRNGYEVTGATPENIRRAAGLEPGDRLLSVNGQRLGDPAQDGAVLATLQNGGKARLEIRRGKQLLTVDRNF